MSEVINGLFLALNVIGASLSALIFILNVFKKKTILKKYGAWGCQGFSFFCMLILLLLASAGFLVQPDKLLGLSLGTMINLTFIVFLTVILVSSKIVKWFENLPET